MNPSSVQYLYPRVRFILTSPSRLYVFHSVSHFQCMDRLMLAMEWHKWPIEGYMLTQCHAMFTEELFISILLSWIFRTDPLDFLLFLSMRCQLSCF